MKTQLVSAAAALVLAAACSNSNDAATSPTTTSSVNFVNNPCSVAGTLTLAVAQVARVDCSNGGTTLTLAGKGASYLVLPQLAVDNVNDVFVGYSLASGSLASASVVPTTRLLSSRLAPKGGAPSSADAAFLRGGRPRIEQMALDRHLRARAAKQLKSGAWRPSTVRSRLAARLATAGTAAGNTAGGRALAAVQAPPAVGSLRSFRILSNWNNNTFSTTTAQLAYVGSSVLLYIDTLAPANGFTPAQLSAFGAFFDQTLYPIDTGAFGQPSDIDNDGHVIMLMSQYVNGLTTAAECNTQGYIAGFFNEEDLGGGTDDPNSNNAEIFYSIVPDPKGTYSCEHPVSDVDGGVPSTFLHELQHLISFSQHVVVNNGNPEAGWLDEGLSIVAEELGSLYYEQKCPPPACRTNASQLFPDSSYNYLDDVLFDSYAYALLPDTASLTLHSDADDGFSWRGGDWLLMRWLGDQFGASIYKKLEHSTATGVANIQSASGQDFPSLFANFGLAIYTDSLPNLARTTAPQADRFLSRNLRQMWGWLYSVVGASSETPYAWPLQLFPITSDTSSAIMNPGTGSYYRLDTPATASTVTIRFSAPGGTALLSGLRPQMAIFRLPSGQ